MYQSLVCLYFAKTQISWKNLAGAIIDPWDYRNVMRIFLSLNQNHVGVKTVLGKTVLGENPLKKKTNMMTMVRWHFLAYLKN